MNNASHLRLFMKDENETTFDRWMDIDVRTAFRGGLSAIDGQPGGMEAAPIPVASTMECSTE